MNFSFFIETLTIKLSPVWNIAQNLMQHGCIGLELNVLCLINPTSILAVFLSMPSDIKGLK
jgi:hypothetical protein